MVKTKEKDTERDSSADKKRRKSSTNIAVESSVSINSIKSPKEDVYSSVVNFEEQESRQRTAEKDSALFHDTCNDLRKLFGEIAELKKSDSEKAKLEVNEKRIDGSFSFVVLKKLNRLDKVRLRSGRDALHKEKLTVDSNRLQLQNLLYEAEHLRKEVQRCFQFKSQDEEIDLVSESEFYEQAPENIARPDKTENDEHARRLARLEWELQQRKELSALCKELQKKKELVAQHIETKTDRLHSLAPRLDALLKATRPLQESLDMNIEDEWKVQKIARLLPRSLYLVYANLSAYAEACDQYLSTSILGDEYEAKQLEDSEKFGKDDLDEDNHPQESDNEDNDAENERTSKSHHHRRQSKSKLKEIKIDNLFKPHPLNVLFKIKTNNSTAALSITLYYLPALNIVTANCKLELGDVVENDVLAPNKILNCLNAGDYGDQSSNPKTNYQLQELSLDPKTLIDLLQSKELGKPYKWAQSLCGLEFVPTQFATASHSSGSISHELAQSSVPDIIKLIRKRWQSRLLLSMQISALEKKNFSVVSDSDKLIDVAVRVSGQLLQWIPITWEDYGERHCTQKFIDENVVSDHDLLYQATIVRGSAKLECFICISANYPIEMPLIALELNWNGKHTAKSNSTIREMESWINAIEPPTNKSATVNMLEVQIKRAMSCLDIYLETAEQTTGKNAVEFPPDKTFLKACRARTRSRPFKIIQNSGSVVYTQI